MLCTGLFPNADTKIQHRRCPTCPLWYDKYQLCSIWLNYVYFCTRFKYELKAQKLQKQHAQNQRSPAEGKGKGQKAQKFQKQHALKGQNLRNPEIRKSARRSGDTQVAQSDYPSGSIRLLKWLYQTTQVAQSDYSSGSISESSRLRKRVQPSASASSAVCVTQFSHILNPVQPHQLVNGSVSFVYLI